MSKAQSILPVRIGMGQMRVEFGRAEANMERARVMIERAADAGCQIVVLPEVMDLGWPYDPATNLAEVIPGPRSEALAAAARRHKIYVLAGLTERAGEQFYNAAVFFSPAGELLHVHRKINTLTNVESVYATGDRLGVVATPYGNVGINICADSFMQTISHTLCRMGAGMILSPSAWAVPGDHDQVKEPYGKLWLNAYGAISRLYGVAFVGVSNVGAVTFGAWKGWRCIGNSLALRPDGKVLTHGPYGVDAEGLLTVEFQCREPAAKGTEWGEYLRLRGYDGP